MQGEFLFGCSWRTAELFFCFRLLFVVFFVFPSGLASCFWCLFILIHTNSILSHFRGLLREVTRK